MEGVLTSFLSIETIVFILIVYLIVAALRKVVEALAPKIAPIFPDKYEPWWVELWQEWILLAAPAIVGGLLGFFIVAYPYPAIFAASISGRTFFGVVCGLCANNTYKFFKYYIKKLVPKIVKEEHKRISPELPEED